MSRTFALLGKDLTDLRQNPAIFLPAALTGFFSILLPFFVAIIVPYMAGEQLSDSSDFEIAIEMYGSQPSSRGLDSAARLSSAPWRGRGRDPARRGPLVRRSPLRGRLPRPRRNG